MPKHEPGYVYLAQWGDYHKIGQSKNPEKRTGYIKQDFGGPYNQPARKNGGQRDTEHPYYKEPVRLIVKQWCPEGAYRKEQELHSQFEARRVPGVRCSEWYRFRLEDATALAAGFGCDVSDVLKLEEVPNA
jgi:hypothetical protein